MAGTFGITILELINNAIRSASAKPLNLGGTSGSGGGGGGPPGGFVGVLPQTKVAYDYSEAASNETSISGSLLDNLNHIRYRISGVENKETVVTFLDLTDTPDTYSGNIGNAVIVNPAGTGLIFGDVLGRITILESGNFASDQIKELDFYGASITYSGQRAFITTQDAVKHIYNEDLSSQVPGSGFTTNEKFLHNTLRLYYNGLRKLSIYFVEETDLQSFITTFATVSGDEILVDYDYQPGTSLGWGDDSWGDSGWGG